MPKVFAVVCCVLNRVSNDGISSWPAGVHLARFFQAGVDGHVGLDLDCR
jgi:hypothetical protein